MLKSTQEQRLLNDRAVVRVLAEGLLAIIHAGGNTGEITAANKLLANVQELQETIDLVGFHPQVVE